MQMMQNKRLEFHILRIQYLQDSDGLIVILSEVLSEVLNKLDMTTKEDVSQDLKPNRTMKNTRDLEKY